MDKPMRFDEIVRALRNACNGCGSTPCCELEVSGTQLSIAQKPCNNNYMSLLRSREGSGGT